MRFQLKIVSALILADVLGVTTHAQSLSDIGVPLLQAVTTNLNGAGVRVAQPEAYDYGTTNWEVNPTNNLVQQPISLFTYFSNIGTANSFPNGLSGYSGHADLVAEYFYGIPNGVATNVAHVDNYNANYFLQLSVQIIGPITNYTATLPSTNIDDPVVNQSFDALDSTIGEQKAIDSAYDTYAANYNTLFVSGVGNGGPVNPPSTCYNGIGVGAYGFTFSSYGPTPDNGRAKPDIESPAGDTSDSTPQVAGAAVILRQAGLRGDGGAATNSAIQNCTIKALLLNGAIKPVGWTNIPPSPLATNYGAGVLDVFNSYKQLTGGKNSYTISTSVSTGSAHPPPVTSGAIGALSGWDFNTNTSGTSSDEINHYFFNVTNISPNGSFTATATLVWNRHANETDINNLALFLYNAANSNLVACSTSVVDNVQQVYVPALAQGRYDLQVWKAGGTPGLVIVSAAEPYALAWEFFSTSMNVSPPGTNISISWPIYPDGFVLQSTTNLLPPVTWSANFPAPIVTNNENVVLLSATNPAQFFELIRP